MDINKINISMGKDVTQPGKIYSITFNEALKIIKSDALKEHTDYLRQETDSEERREYKVMNLPFITPNGEFSYRANNKLKKASGFMVLDYDESYGTDETERIKKILLNDEFVFCAFTSPSGAIKFIIKIPIVKTDSRFKKYFFAVKDYFETIGIKLDESGKDISRSCFLSYDPKLFLNNDSTIFEKKKDDYKESETTNKKEGPKPKSKKSRSEREFSQVLKYIIQQKSKTEIFELMKPFSKWCESSDSYREITYKKAYEYYLKHKNENKKTEFKPYNEVEDPEDQIEIIRERKACDLKIYKDALSDFNTHLHNYDAIQKEILYNGLNIDVLSKQLWYSTNSLVQKPLKIVINSNLLTDNRIHEIYIGTQGHGKGLIKNFKKRIGKYANSNTYEITALSHTQQLIGKTKWIGAGNKKEKKVIPGILSCDNLLNDEAGSVLNEKDAMNEDSMRVIRQALDCFGDNEISKKMIEDDFDDKLSYISPTRITMLIHPEPLNNIFFSSGTYRRFNSVFELESKNEINISEITKIKLCNDKDNVYPYSSVLPHFYEKQFSNLNYTESCLDIISDFVSLILHTCLNDGNKGLFRFGLMSLHSLKINVIKYVNVLHVAYKKVKSNEDLTIKACMDFWHVWSNSIETTLKYGRLDLHVPEWDGIDDKLFKDKYLDALDYLLMKGAISEEKSKVTIKRFQSVLGEIFGVQLRQARGRMSTLKSKGYISSKAVGKNSSVVWLNKVPNELKILDKDFKPNCLIKYLNEKVKTFKGGNGVFLGLPPSYENFDLENGDFKGFFTDEEINIFKGGKGGLVPPPIFINNIHVSNLKILYFIKYIYKKEIGVPTLPPLPPTKHKLEIVNIEEDVLIEEDGNEQKTPLPPLEEKEDNFENDDKKTENKPLKPLSEKELIEFIADHEGKEGVFIHEILEYFKRDFDLLSINNLILKLKEEQNIILTSTGKARTL